MRGGRKVSGGGKASTNKDHRTLKRTIYKGRWDDICAEQLLPENVEAVLAKQTAVDPDKPGLGQFYCIACSRYYISAKALQEHSATTKHRRRLKMLTTEKPYSHKEANAAAGRGDTDTGVQERRPVPMTMA
mmetsp:Transcript_13179/g.28048  ORF Transcript_13179/g.28048 Transcript_13179/m.28048 type:complete len:131 (+) Transcript_13179:295-687(+)|eukprot:737056-Pleurochrysis_carterae.AAC.4